MLYYVYCLARPVKVKRHVEWRVFYVGKGSKRRVFDHEREARGGHQCHKCNVIRKTWREGNEIQRYIMLTTESEQEAYAYECELIALHGRENLCNKTDGGEGGIRYELTDEIRVVLSNAQRRLWADPAEREKRTRAIKKARSTIESRAKTSSRLIGRAVSEQTRAKIGQASMGKHTRLGHTNTPEHRSKISRALKGRKNTPEQIERMRQSKIGRKMSLTDSERQRRADLIKTIGKPFKKGNKPTFNGSMLSAEARRKISQTLKETSPWIGRNHTEESRQKMSKAARARNEASNRCYEITDPIGTTYTTNILRHFCHEHGLRYNRMQEAMRSGRAYKGWRITRVADR